MLVQCRGRWTIVKATLIQRIVTAGLPQSNIEPHAHISLLAT